MAGEYAVKTQRIFPTAAQVRQLPLQFSMTVPPHWQDRNGHVNVQFYQTLYELGAYQVLEEVDAGKSCLLQHDFGLFDLEHHLYYRAEILVGDKVSTYNRILGRNEKRFHGMYLIVNDSRDQLACTLEYITAGVALQDRRMAAFPGKLKQGIDEQMARQRQLDWAAPVCGAMGVA